jgi:hypothetical protein
MDMGGKRSWGIPVLPFFALEMREPTNVLISLKPTEQRRKRMKANAQLQSKITTGVLLHITDESPNILPFLMDCLQQPDKMELRFVRVFLNFD